MTETIYPDELKQQKLKKYNKQKKQETKEKTIQKTNSLNKKQGR